MHGNCHSLAAKLPNILLLIKYIIEDSLFREQLGWIGPQSILQQLAFPDLFADDTACLATGLELDRYVYATYRNWDNYEPDNEVAVGNEENDEKMEDIKGSPDNLYAFYDI